MLGIPAWKNRRPENSSSHQTRLDLLVRESLSQRKQKGLSLACALLCFLCVCERDSYLLCLIGITLKKIFSVGIVRLTKLVSEHVADILTE